MDPVLFGVMLVVFAVFVLCLGIWGTWYSLKDQDRSGPPKSQQ